MNPAPHSQGRILITEDEFGLRQTLHKTLHALGFQITEASSGEQALRLIKEQRVDVVLLDINMPGMGGIEACRQLRKIAPGLQILMLTVRDSEEDKVRAIDSGADDYITKPFSLPELAARIRAAVRRSMAIQPSETAAIRIGDIELDPVRRIVRKAEQPVSLSPKEF